jgi:hypothetical protein
MPQESGEQSGVGRLRVTEALSEVRVQVPVEQYLVAVVYWGVYGVIAVGAVVVVLSGPVGGEILGSMFGAQGVLGGVAAAVWQGLSGLIRRMQAGSRLAGVVLSGGVFLLSSLMILLVVGPNMAVAALLAWVVASLSLLIIKVLVGPAVVVSIDQATVTVLHRGERISIPLETITHLAPARRWRSHAVLGEVSVPGLAGMSDAEWDWLSERIRQSAERRRAVLAAEGHDLSEAAAPPAALEALTHR